MGLNYQDIVIHFIIIFNTWEIVKFLFKLRLIETPNYY